MNKSVLLAAMLAAFGPVTTAAHAQTTSTGSGQAASTSSGQAFPAKQIRLVVPLAPGGNLDIVARAAAAPMGEAL